MAEDKIIKPEENNELISVEQNIDLEKNIQQFLEQMA